MHTVCNIFPLIIKYYNFLLITTKHTCVTTHTDSIPSPSGGNCLLTPIRVNIYTHGAVNKLLIVLEQTAHALVVGFISLLVMATYSYICVYCFNTISHDRMTIHRKNSVLRACMAVAS